MKRLYLVFELAFVVLGILIGRYLSDFTLVPRSIIILPTPFVSEDDFLTTAEAMFAICAVVFVALSFIAGPGVFQRARRTAAEIYGLIFGVTLSSLALFLFFDVVYAPNLLLGIALSIFALFIVGHVVGASLFAVGGASRNPVAALGRLLWEGIRHIVRPAGILTLLFALSPLVLAKMFATDRDFANKVTQIRLYFLPQQKTEWGLINAFPGTAFLRPIDLQFPPGGDKEIYVLERDGAFYRAPYSPGMKIANDRMTKLLDLKDKLGDVEFENGALGFALHPEFGKSGAPNGGFVYLYYTEFKTTYQVNHLSRFDISLPTIEQRMASEVSLFALTRNPTGFHNGGCLKFGADGYLYVSLGEAMDSAGHQTLGHSLFAGILRIDVDRRGGDKSHPITRQPFNGKTGNYFIPNDNPFGGRPDSMEEFWAIGLRNAFRFSFDPATGDMWAGDVGTDVWEEVDRIHKGGNYQYPYKEGFEDQQGVARPAPLIGTEYPPVYAYHHTSFDRAVIGGVVYRGKKYPQLAGLYIFADNYSGKVFAFDAKRERVGVKEVRVLAQASEFLAQRGVTSLTETPDGEIVLTALGRVGVPTGEILKLVPAKEAAAVVASTAPAAPVAADGKAIFIAECTRCHGTGGKGDGPDAATLITAFKLARMPDFTSAEFQNKVADEQIERVIKKGGPAIGLSEGMPPWESLYKDAEIKAVAQYVRSLRK